MRDPEANGPIGGGQETLDAASAPGGNESPFTLVIHHPDGNDLVPLAADRPLVVGRSRPADIVLADPRLSRAHVRFMAGEGAVVVEDLASRNGTWLDGARVSRARVEAGAELHFGSSIARVVRGASTPPDVEPPVRIAVPSSRGGRAEGGVFASRVMRELCDLADQLASSRMPLLLRGETGTGKEILARRIHEQARGGARPLVCVNCAAIAEQLVESTLFGHERGAFTGAHAPRKGVFEEADGGTLFLDEVGELPLAAQAALLRVIETGIFHRVGSARETRVDVRVVAATNRDLAPMTRDGRFRADLLYRLNALMLDVPPLRERMDDVGPLARHFLALANEANGRAVEGIAPDALAALGAYAWPGNVRELRNAIERAVVVNRSGRVALGDLPRSLRGAADADTGRASVPPVSESDASGAGPTSLRASVRHLETQMILQALRDAEGRRTVAAAQLGMPLRTLANKMKALGLQGDGDDDSDP